MAAHDIESIEVDRTRHVFVEFSDGVTVTFDLARLRLACPCAECSSRRQKGQTVSIMAETKPENVAITEAAMAGNWGLNLDWNDGHSTGIYAFEKLRQWIDDPDLFDALGAPSGNDPDAQPVELTRRPATD